jgi:hypothetical protein
MKIYQNFHSLGNFREWVAQARSIRIEAELARRGIRPGDPCPKCGTRLKVNTATQVWSCERLRGDVVSLVQHLDSVGFVLAARTLTGRREPSARKQTAAGISTTNHHTQHNRRVVLGRALPPSPE